jgi:SAM-dependent methyltransferase
MSLERLIPHELKVNETTGLSTLELHLERYRFAARHMCLGSILDIACGVGYGSLELIQGAGVGDSNILGVDNSIDSIDLARTHYAHPKIEYLVADAMRFESIKHFDTVITLETIEHLPDPERFLLKMIGFLRKGGRIICSAPVTPSVDVNPYHLHDFTQASFRRLGSNLGLREVACLDQVQPFSVLSILNKQEERMRELRQGLFMYYASHPNSLIKRVISIFQNGFTNRYLTVVWEKEKK